MVRRTMSGFIPNPDQLPTATVVTRKPPLRRSMSGVVDSKTCSSTPEPSTNQYTEARKSLQSVGSSKTHKNQVPNFVLRASGKAKEDDTISFAKAAAEGNFAKLISLLASQKKDDDRIRVMNEARRRPRSEKPEAPLEEAASKKSAALAFFQSMSKTGGATKPKDWYHLTPLAIAALNGRANVVEYLLRQGADPTLRGSPSDDEDYNALEAAKQGLKVIEKDIDSVLSSSKDEILQLQSASANANKGFLSTDVVDESPMSPLALAQSLVQKRDQSRMCVALLEAVEKFWPRAQAYSSHYRKRIYNNKPTNMKALRAALDAITMEGHRKPNSQLVPSLMTDSLVNRLASKIAACSKSTEEKPVVSADDKTDTLSEITKKLPKPKKVSNKGRRYSDSFCLPPLRTTTVADSAANKALAQRNLQHTKEVVVDGVDIPLVQSIVPQPTKTKEVVVANKKPLTVRHLPQTTKTEATVHKTNRPLAAKDQPQKKPIKVVVEYPPDYQGPRVTGTLI